MLTLFAMHIYNRDRSIAWCSSNYPIKVYHS